MRKRNHSIIKILLNMFSILLLLYPNQISMNNEFVCYILLNKYVCLSYLVLHIRLQFRSLWRCINLLIKFFQTILLPNHLLQQMQHFRSEEHTSELQSQFHLVCRLLLEKKFNFFKVNFCVFNNLKILQIFKDWKSYRFSVKL